MNRIRHLNKEDKKKIRIIVIIAFVIVSVIGTLAHFAYEWSGFNKFLGLITPVNESTWEHMKLIFFPMLIVGIVVWFFIKDYINCTVDTLLAGLLYATWSIPILFYTYRGILGFGIMAVDIAIFFISVAIGFICIYRDIKVNDCRWERWSILLIILTFATLICFILFTYNPPKLGIFENPLV